MTKHLPDPPPDPSPDSVADSIGDRLAASQQLLMALPCVLPIFPLAGVLLLPRGRLPLHIFEPRYIAMVEDCLIGERLIGMVQPCDPGSEEAAPAVYSTGCAGRITAFRELEHGRYLITLTGVCRFQIAEELALTKDYRRVVPQWEGFSADLLENDRPGIDRSRLLGALPDYLSAHKIVADWKTIAGAPDERLVTSLSMICPFDPNEKQALLEATALSERAELLTALIEMALIKCGSHCHGGQSRH